MSEWIPLKRVMFANDHPVQTLPESLQGQHSEYHHVASKAVSIALNESSGVIRIRGSRTTRYAHIANTKESDELPISDPLHPNYKPPTPPKAA